MKRDNLHFNFSKVDGYNKPFNAIISPREDGKSTSFWLDKAYPAFKKGRTTIVLRRRGVDITEKYINSIGLIIQKFVRPDFRLSFKVSQFHEGIVDVYADDELFFSVVALSCPLQRIKSLMQPDPAYIFFDEFIINVRMGEKYIPDEWFKIKEIYNTFYRESSKTLKFYACGNPYSLYSPILSAQGYSPKDVWKKGIAVYGNFLVDYHKLNPELEKIILEKNPLYEFESDYFDYALSGKAINDRGISIAPFNGESRLYFLIVIEGKRLAIWRKPDYTFWVGHHEGDTRRDIISISIDDLYQGTRLFDNEMKMRLRLFKGYFNYKKIEYEDLECYYLIEGIHSLL